MGSWAAVLMKQYSAALRPREIAILIGQHVAGLSPAELRDLIVVADARR